MGLTDAQLIAVEQSGGDTGGTIEAIRAIRDSEERLRALLDTSIEGIITIDDRGVIQSTNPAAERIFGYESGEAIGRNVSILMPEPYRSSHDDYIANYQRTRRPKIIGIGREVVGLRKNGEMFPMDLSVSEVRLSKRTLYAGFVRDISERRRLENEILEISEREKRRIGQDLHDDLGQRLTGIELMSRVLENRLKSSSPSDSRHAAEIARLVRDAIGRTRQLARGLTPMVSSAEGLVSALEDLARSTRLASGIECAFDARGVEGEFGDLVATHLFRIAQEAVSNATRHSGASRIEIVVRETAGDFRLMVRDNGKGLPGADRRQGRGLGLRLMQYRAGIIGGSFLVESQPEGGVTVACTVKRERIDMECGALLSDSSRETRGEA